VTGFIVRRLLQGVVVMFGVTTLIFFMSRLSGDPVALLAGPTASAEDIRALSAQLGLDQPLPVQYVRFLARVAQGDLGQSLRYRQPALGIVVSSLPATLELATAALTITILLSFPLGIIAAVKRNTWIDRAVTTFALAGFTVPPFWLGILLILVFPLGLGMFYTSGRGTPQHLVLPSIALALTFVGRLTRVIRGSMIEILLMDYVRTAHAKGVPRWQVLWRHAFRNVLLSVATLLGLQIALMLGGAVLIETVFAWPGIGWTAVTAITQRDYPVIQAATMVTALIVVLTTMVVDLSYVVIDPRIRYGDSRPR
jgi:peptide/nickel transport system permease protein